MDFRDWIDKNKLHPDIESILVDQELNTLKGLKELPKGAEYILGLKTDHETSLAKALQRLRTGFVETDDELAKWAVKNEISQDSVQKLKKGGIMSLDALTQTTLNDFQRLKIKAGEWGFFKKGIEDLIKSPSENDYVTYLRREHLNDETTRKLIDSDWDTIHLLQHMDKYDVDALDLTESQKRQLMGVIRKTKMKAGIEKQPPGNENDYVTYLRREHINDETTRKLIDSDWDTIHLLQHMDKYDVDALDLTESQKRQLMGVIRKTKMKAGIEKQPPGNERKFTAFLKDKHLNEKTIQIMIQKGYGSFEALKHLDEDDVITLKLPKPQNYQLMRMLQESKRIDETKTELFHYEEAFKQFLKELMLEELTISKLLNCGVDCPEGMIMLLDDNELENMELSTDQRTILKDAIDKLKMIDEANQFEAWADENEIKRETLQHLKSIGIDSIYKLKQATPNVFHHMEIEDGQTRQLTKAMMEWNASAIPTSSHDNSDKSVVNDENMDILGISDAIDLFDKKMQKQQKTGFANVASYLKYTESRPEIISTQRGIRIIKLPIKQVYEDCEAKVRKCVIGIPNLKKQQKTILFVGATGAGKTTLIDSMCNYMFDTKCEDNNRFQITDEHLEEKKHMVKEQITSRTDWITIYQINSGHSNKLPYTLNMIDTPGFGGFDRDQTLVKQIKSLFLNRGSHGIDEIDAVCYVAKASDSQLSLTQQFIFTSMLYVFGDDITCNFVVMVTFADLVTNPVVGAIDKANLFFQSAFTFNNVSADGKDGATVTLYRELWDMNTQSFENLFNFLETVFPVSLCLTSEVLERKKLKDTLNYLEGKVSLNLSIMNSLQYEENVLCTSKDKIVNGKDFKYKMNNYYSVYLASPPGRHITHCMICYNTCHDYCTVKNDDDRANCDVIDQGTGKCIRCNKNCHWKDHKNTSYYIECTSEEVERSWEKTFRTYQETKIIDKETDILKMVGIKYDKIKTETRQYFKRCLNIFNRLRVINMKPDPMTEVEYIEHLIRIQKDEHNVGWQGRIQELQNLKMEKNIS